MKEMIQDFDVGKGDLYPQEVFWHTYVPILSNLKYIRQCDQSETFTFLFHF